ncbi:IclR family transcriptional regulator [Streptomyces sp. NPDC002790]|uniref:IclR family transcriptional regulator n=1 Tax=Streptomyces sp. NPDC002790 TaxID=3154431 RepID=UPI00332D094D
MTGRESSAVPAASSGQYRERNSTADKALDILGLFSDERLSLSGQEVAQALGTARSTAYRYLQSLVAGGFLEEDPRGGFRLGMRVLELARLARRRYGLSEIAVPVMEKLCEQVQETVLLTRRSGTRAICLEKCEAGHAVRISYERGGVLPVNAGAAALVLLAWLPKEEARRLLESEPLQRFTARTLTDVDALQARLATIRREGQCVTWSELDEDVLGVAAPVFDASGSVVSALSIAALERRVPDSRLEEVVSAVREAAAQVTTQLELATA